MDDQYCAQYEQHQPRSMRKRSTQDLLIHSHTLNRRSVIAGLPLLVAGCSGSGRFGSSTMQDGGFTVPEINLANVDPSLLRQEVAWRGNERPGSIVVVVPERRLFLVQGNGRALRYAVGVGRAEVLNFRGSAVIGRKEQWPRWTPTAHMIAAMPRYRPYAGGMDGGPDNPLGARALYLYRDGQTAVLASILASALASAAPSGLGLGLRSFLASVLASLASIPASWSRFAVWLLP